MHHYLAQPARKTMQYMAKLGFELRSCSGPCGLGGVGSIQTRPSSPRPDRCCSFVRHPRGGCIITCPASHRAQGDCRAAPQGSATYSGVVHRCLVCMTRALLNKASDCRLGTSNASDNEMQVFPRNCQLTVWHHTQVRIRASSDVESGLFCDEHLALSN
jgi:hypothetical protein